MQNASFLCTSPDARAYTVTPVWTWPEESEVTEVTALLVEATRVVRAGI